MSDETKPDLPATTEDEAGTALGVVTDLISDSTIPPQLDGTRLRLSTDFAPL